MRVHRAALGLGAQVGRVAEHLGQRHLRADDLRVAARLHALDVTAATVEVADDVAHELLGGDDLDRHHRLEQHRRGLAQALLDRHRAGDLERHLRGVDLVVGAVDELDLDVDDREAGEHAGAERLLDALVDRRDVLLGNRAADDLVLELVAVARLLRNDVDDDVAVLAAATGLAGELHVDVVDALAGGLAVRDLRLADVRLDLELAQQAVDDDLEVQLAHAGDDRLAGLRVGADAERRVLLGELGQAVTRACPARPWSSARWRCR